MKRIRRKIVLACSAVLMLLLTTVTTTFAWFSLNESAWLQGMTLEVNNSKNLLIAAGSGELKDLKFKQYLTAEDIVAAIKAYGAAQVDDGDKKPSDVYANLSPVTTTDGKTFFEQEVTYDSMNRKYVKLVPADKNSYITMTVSFIVEDNNDLNARPTYNLKFVLDDVEDLKGTKFRSGKQQITLVNDLVDGVNGAMKPGDVFTVDLVNALKVAVTNRTTSKTYIYDIGSSQMTNVNYEINHGGLADEANKDTNAMYTYYSNINGLYGSDSSEESEGPLKPLPAMGPMSGDVELLSELNNVLGTIAPVTNIEYEVVTLDIAIWIEGYDADCIIGLDTTMITTLLTFMAEEQ